MGCKDEFVKSNLIAEQSQATHGSPNTDADSCRPGDVSCPSIRQGRRLRPYDPDEIAGGKMRFAARKSLLQEA
jgi:hypothetical protein